MAKKILLTLDGNRSAAAAMRVIADVCAPEDEVTLLAVAALPAPVRQTADAGRSIVPGRAAPLLAGVAQAVEADVPLFIESRDQAIQRTEDELKDYLEDKSAGLRGLGLRIEKRILLDHNAGEAIVRFAEAYEPDFIVLPLRARSRIGEMLFGSVASAILRSNVAPVILVNA
jgi:nucleotide-binding universal stress UspA family protein